MTPIDSVLIFKSAQFKFHYDLFHGWLEVPLEMLKALKIDMLISSSSCINGEFAYLEQDLDFPIFLRAYVKQSFEVSSQPFFDRCEAIYDGDVSPIRTFHKYNRNTVTIYQN